MFIRTTVLDERFVAVEAVVYDEIETLPIGFEPEFLGEEAQR